MIEHPRTMKLARLAALARAGVLALAALVIGGCAAPRPARTAIAVAVLEVKGAEPGTWEPAVADLARARQLEVIAADRYWLMAARLGARPLTAPNVARVARAIGATAVVHGKLDAPAARARSRGRKRRARARRGREVVTLYVRDGETGRVVEKHRVVLGRGRAARRSRAALDRRLLSSVVVPVESKPPSPAETPARAPAAATAQVAAPAPAKRGTPPPDRAEPAEPVLYDDEGQAIDDERPPPQPR
jgi:hypothetical protein